MKLSISESYLKQKALYQIKNNYLLRFKNVIFISVANYKNRVIFQLAGKRKQFLENWIVSLL